ncbi:MULTISPECIES: DUF1761 domain-containing protein [Carnobacterium]|jgi:hypothetical protein|uniref:DUF1761 domain-containing protein n=1 Tax=Carnobacterium TaxID=2747 RepID=UPI000E71BDB7|nr:DUF1761 domain-containing protein [Carnobacterium maltaromaticum]AOA02826.1 hypothetical protein BFC23_10100 [Carnobacterium maltaromaticum]MCI1819597.1 DUF1761 domain-containing protein [Carnobacterium maltaromaticum]CAD5900206.1 putative membrane protein [Carnobacterium maltaromaticum]CAD5902761.1 putative membrane protein [Carnobacterium maltaromaticum]
MNLLLTLGAGILAFFIGALWYTVFFGKSWIIESGMTEEKIKEQGGAGISMVSTLVMEILVAFLVTYLIRQTNLPIMTSGLLITGIAILSSLKNYVFEKKSIKLILINESYKAICILIMSASVFFFN